MKRLWLSPTLRSVAVYGASGAGFAAANLVLARVLSPHEYAMVTLVVALYSIGAYIAPVGLDGVVNRVHLETGPRLLRQVLVASGLIAAVFATIAGVAYHTPLTLTVLTFVAVMAGGPLVLAAAQFQSEHRFGPSLALLQSTNVILFAAALLTVMLGETHATLTILVMTVGTVLGALWGWWVLLRERHAKPHRSAHVPWREAFAFVGMQIAGLVLVQVERLMLPHLLPLSELATYGVLAAVAGSLFRVLQMGVGYSLLPRLRRTSDLRQRRRLVSKELRLVAVVVVVGSAAIVVAVPLVERWFLAGKYHLGAGLILAALVSGIAKIANALAKAVATAMASPRELSIANISGWVTIVIAAAGAAVGARWGLAGVIYGVSLGWALRALVFTVIAVRHLRLPAAQPLKVP